MNKIFIVAVLGCVVAYAVSDVQSPARQFLATAAAQSPSEQLIAKIETEQRAAYWRAVSADGNSLLAQSVSDQSNAQLCAMAAPLASLTEWTGTVKSVRMYQTMLILTLDIGDNYRVEYHALHDTPELLPAVASVSPGTTVQFTAQLEDACGPFKGGPHYSSRIYIEKGHLSFKTISNIRPGRS